MRRMIPPTHAQLCEAAEAARAARITYENAMSDLHNYAAPLAHRWVKLTAAERNVMDPVVFVQRRHKGGEWSSKARLGYFTLPASADGSTTAMVSEVVVETYGLIRLVLIIPGQSDEFQVNAEQFKIEVLEHLTSS